jgi:predicted PurR-regulated permease PerM
MSHVAVNAPAREASHDPSRDSRPPRGETPPESAAAEAAPRARYRQAARVAVVVLAAIAVIGLLRWAQGFFIPFIAGLLIAYALRPIVDALERLHLPRTLSAGVVLVLVVAALGGGVYALGDDFERALATLPDAARKVRLAVEDGQRDRSSPIAHVQQAAKELEQAATPDPKPPAARRPAASQPATGIALQLQQYVLRQAASALGVLSEIALAILLAFFLLLAGDSFRRKLMQLVGPSLTRKRMTLEVLQEIDVQVQRYMFVTMVTNLAVALAVAALAAAVGLEEPAAWGIAAGLLHLVPYAGAVLAAIALAVGGLLQFGSLAAGALLGAGTLLVVAAIGMVFQTWLQSRASKVNAVAVFVGLLFFGWLWGAWGLVLGAPLIAIAKTIADRVAQPVASLLG